MSAQSDAEQAVIEYLMTANSVDQATASNLLHGQLLKAGASGTTDPILLQLIVAYRNTGVAVE